MLDAVMMQLRERPGPGGPDWLPAGRTALLVPVRTAAAAAAAVAAGADALDLAGAGPGVLAAVIRAHPGLPVCTVTGSTGLTRDLGAAVRHGAALLCPGLPAARAAAAAGLDRGRLLVTVPPAQLAAAAAAGWTVLAEADQPGDEGAPVAAVIAVAALCCWLGAAVVTSRHTGPVRRALDMTDSIRGTRPPARTIRGLA